MLHDKLRVFQFWKRFGSRFLAPRKRSPEHIVGSRKLSDYLQTRMQLIFAVLTENCRLLLSRRLASEFFPRLESGVNKFSKQRNNLSTASRSDNVAAPLESQKVALAR